MEIVVTNSSFSAVIFIWRQRLANSRTRPNDWAKREYRPIFWTSIVTKFKILFLSELNNMESLNLSLYNRSSRKILVAKLTDSSLKNNWVICTVINRQWRKLLCQTCTVLINLFKGNWNILFALNVHFNHLSGFFLVKQVTGSWNGLQHREFEDCTLSAVGDWGGGNYSVEAWCHCMKVWSVVVLLLKRGLNSLP